MPRLRYQVGGKDPKPEECNLNTLEIQGRNGKQLPNSDSSGSCSSKGDNDSNFREESEISWDDLHLGDAIGQGRGVYLCSISSGLCSKFKKPEWFVLASQVHVPLFTVVSGMDRYMSILQCLISYSTSII